MTQSHPWSGLLWYWTVRWRWKVTEQRQLLAWWQSVGWEAGWRVLLAASSLTQSGSDQPRAKSGPGGWAALKEFLDSADWRQATEETFPWVSMVDPNFPTALRSVDSAPTVLWSNRPWDIWPGVVLGVVGSRRASAYGRLAVQSLVPEFARRYNALIVSGGAHGIDQAAHEAALQVEQPTWVILGCGMSHAPSRLKRYGQTPARLVSPFPPSDPPVPWRFPARNRVIAQLVSGVVIVEAAAKSGSLITAAAALEANKEVLVVLPPFTSPNCAGALRLLQQGASPVATAQDIAVALGLASTDPGKSTPNLLQLARTEPEKRVLEQLRQRGGQCGWTPLMQHFTSGESWETTQAASVITSLELRGVLQVELGVVRLSGMIQS